MENRIMHLRKPKPNNHLPHNKNKHRGFFLSMLALLLVAAFLHFFEDTSHRGTQPDENEIVVTFLDVGQGDSIVIRSRDNAVLIDGGEFSQRDVVLGYLREAGIRRLCFVVATHPHSDHIGSLGTVLGRMEVGALIMPDRTNNTIAFEALLESIESNNIPVTFPDPGYRLKAGIIDLTVLAPHDAGASNLNNASIVTRLEHGETSFLFTGDAEAESEAAMVSGGMKIESNVLKVGHHGSRTSTTKSFLDRVNPSVAVISVGTGNNFGHPNEEVVAQLESAGIAVYRTDKHGTIQMVTNGRQIFMLE